MDLSAPLVWITAPPSGGRAGLGRPLVAAFRRIGCRAEEMSFSLLQEQLSPSLSIDERGRAVVTEFWLRFCAERPALLLDLSPLPGQLVDQVRRAGARAAFWLIEDAFDPAYDYWKETAPAYDLFFTFQGPPFEHPGARYLAWGASSVNRPDAAPLAALLLHGTATPHREAFLRDFVTALGESRPPVRVIGPGWARVRRGAWPDHVTFESRWTDPETTVRLLAGQIVLIPQSRSINAVAPRLWETLAAGACVLAEACPVLARHFEIGRDLLVFRSAVEAVTTARTLIADPATVSSIIRSGQAALGERGLLEHRAAEILIAAGIAP